MSSHWFGSWSRVVTLVVVLVVAYAWVVVVLRVSGKRTLAKLSAFDFVVTIALGSTLSSVVVSRSVPLVEGLLALLGLVVLQFVVARSTVASSLADRLVKSRPTALVVRGELQEDAMRRCRVRADEVAAAIRKGGMASIRQVDLVVLETDGTFSVLVDTDDGSALEGISGFDRAPDAPAGGSEGAG